MVDPLDLSNIEELRKEGLKALAERLGPIGMVNFIRLFNNGFGDYSTERQSLIENLSETDFLEFIKDKL